jgi:hypothetical protein
VWDQNAGLYVLGPAASVVEEIAGAWLAELLGLPKQVSVGFVTGAQLANTTALAAARYEILRRVGWDTEGDGLRGAPKLRVIAGQGRHGTIDRVLRLLGLGTASIVEVEMDAQGRMQVAALRQALERDDGPTIVCAQVGNVNTGAVDPVGEICELAHGHGAWVGRRRVRAVGRGQPAAARLGGAPTRGPPMPTSGSTCRTTPAWSSAPSPMHTEPRWAYGPSTSCIARTVNATRSTTTLSIPGALAASRSTPRSGRWAGVALPRWSSDAAPWRGASRSSWPPLTAWRCSTRLCSTKCSGRTNREIARELFLSPCTVEMHVSSILMKLNGRSRVDAARRASELGLLIQRAD